MKRRFLLMFACAAFTAAPVVAAEIGVAAPPFLYTGRIRDFNGMGLDVSAGGKAVIRAYKEGVLLAVSPIVTSESTANNYCLRIPMGTVAGKETAQVGDVLTFEVDDGAFRYDLKEVKFEPVGNPGRTSTVNFVAAEDANANGVADEYEAAIEDLLPLDHPFYGKPYDPKADYDGDGISNLDEYLAGTDPLTSGDRLAIVRLEPVEGQASLLRADFVTAPGRVYALRGAETVEALAEAKENEPFQREPQAEASQHTLYHETEESAQRTIYLLKRGPSRFWRLRLAE